MWASTVSIVYMGYFCLLVFKFSLGSLGAFPIFNDLVSTFHLNFQIFRDICTAKMIVSLCRTDILLSSK